MKNVSCWREPTAATTADYRLQACFSAVQPTGCRQQQNIDVDDLSTVWRSIQRMVVVQPPHLHEPHRPPSTQPGLLSTPGCCRPAESSVDEEVSRLLCRPPSPALPQPVARHRRTKRRAAGPAQRYLNSLSDHASTPTSCVAEPEAVRDITTSLCRMRRKTVEDFQRPCLNFYKMQAS